MDGVAGTLGGAVEQITAGLARVDDAAFVRASDRELLAAVPVLESLTARLEWVRAHVVGEVDARGLAAEAGACSTPAWLAGGSRAHPGSTSRLVGLARALPRYHRTDAALAAGTISAEAARVITKTVDAVVADAARADVSHDRQVLARAEAELLVQAGRLSAAQGLARVAARLRPVLDPTQGDGIAREEARPVERRELHVSTTFDGMVAIKGLLDPEAGAHLLTWLSATAAGRGAGDPRTPARRRADALVELLTYALDVGAAPIDGGERAHVAVTIDIDSMRRQVGAGGVLDIGSVLSAESVRRLACDGLILPVLLGSRGAPLDVGRATRSLPRAIRRALVARDHGRAFPGCDRPPAWCHGHHIWHWADGGPTCLSNLVLLCPHHHRLVHHGGWGVTINPVDALPDFRPPAWVDPDRTPVRQPRDPDWTHPPERPAQPT